jgi:hypothetical protein
MVNVTVSPTLGVASLTDLLTCRSACCGASVALALSFVLSGSNWSAAETVAVLVRASGLTTRAPIISTALAPSASVPTVHTPVRLS